MSSVYLILGGNLGDRQKNLEVSRHIIGLEIGIIQRFSGIYETEPWGFEDSRNFLNQVIEISTSLNPMNVLGKIKKIEAGFGRSVNQSVKYQPRKMDIDMLFYDHQVINLPELIIPHPLLHERNFVLAPLCELAADFIHPTLNKTIHRLKAECRDKKWTRPVKE
jgi:2-amino-4-hydroxy-6-hydroxymethyldihydropteridine diphosphokinase